MPENGLFELIRDLYPVSTIMIILTLLGFSLASFAYRPYIKSLERQLGLRDAK